MVGKENLWVTNLKNGNSIKSYAKVFPAPVKDIHLKNACLLDPAAPKKLTPKEAAKFDYFIFGGILGDYPPQQRTKELLTPFVKAEPRNIGKKQFSTDNAVAVVKLIREGTPLEKISFQQDIEIPMGKNESLILPYLYVLDNKSNKPLISSELIKYLKKKKGF